MKRTIPCPLLLVISTFLSLTGLGTGQVTVFHYRVNDTDTAGLPAIPSVGGSPGTAIGGTPFNLDVPTVGVPPGSGNRSIQGAGLAGGGVNSTGTQELLNADVITNGGFTFECWFKWFGAGNVNSIIDYAGTEKFRIPSGAGFPLDMNFDSGSGPLILDAAPTTNEWHYVAMVFVHDGNPEVGGKINGTATWYYDSDTATGSAGVIKDDFGDSLNRPIGVGRHPLGFGGDNFDGLVYEPRVTLGALDVTGLLFSLAPTSDPQLVAPPAVTDPSDGNAIQLTIPLENLAGTTLDLVLTAPGLSGPDLADFSVNSFETPIAADGGTGNIVVDFSPSAGDGVYEAILTINSNDPVNPTLDVALTVDVRDPAIDLLATILDFGVHGEVPGMLSQFVDVKNLGGLTALTLGNPQIVGAGASAYMLTGLPASVPPLGSDLIEISFEPLAGGDFPATLMIETNDPRNPVVSIDLIAQVRDPEILIGTGLPFGAFPNNPGPTTLGLTVDNFGLGTALTFSNPQFSGPAAAAYSIATLPASIAPNGFDTIEVTFDPGTAGGAFPAVLTLETNDPFTPSVSISLSAFAEGPIDLEGASKFSHWTFDDPGNLGDDSGGLNYDGTVNGDAQPSALAVVGSGALLLDGDGDYIEIPQGAIPYTDVGGDGEGFTVAVWVCSSSAPNTFNRQRYFSKFFTTGGGGFGVGQNNDTQLIATTYGVADYLGATSPVQDEWHHVAYVFSGGSPNAVDYYMDGVFVATVTGNAGLNAGPGTYAIGGLGGGAGEFFDGLLDDLRVYAVELPAADIATLAAMGTPGAKPTPGGLILTGVDLVNPTRLRIEFSGAPNTLHEVKSSPDLAASPFTGAVTPAVDGLTTDGTGAGFVEIDIAVPGAEFFQIQQP